MKIHIHENAAITGAHAAKEAARRIREAIDARGVCRLLLSTGASQFEVLEALVKEQLPWDKVVMFHLDEYINMPESHPASFRKYLRERFIDIVHPMAYHFVDGEGDAAANVQALSEVIREAPVDVALIGIGENAHIAFNDPPADFDTREAYIFVDLDERCRRQQMGEGWFASLDEVPTKAISMSVWQIMQSRAIISVVAGTRKAQAIKMTLESDTVTNMIPATKLREHADCSLYLDKESAALTDSRFLG